MRAAWCVILCFGYSKAFVLPPSLGTGSNILERGALASTSEPDVDMDVMPPRPSSQSSLKDDLLSEVDLASASDKR